MFKMQSPVIFTLIGCLWLTTKPVNGYNYTEKELDDFEHELIKQIEKHRISPHNKDSFNGICSRELCAHKSFKNTNPYKSSFSIQINLLDRKSKPGAMEKNQ